MKRLVALIQVCQVNVPVIKIILSPAGPRGPRCVTASLLWCQIRPWATGPGRTGRGGPHRGAQLPQTQSNSVCCRSVRTAPCRASAQGSRSLCALLRAASPRLLVSTSPTGGGARGWRRCWADSPVRLQQVLPHKHGVNGLPSAGHRQRAVIRRVTSSSKSSPTLNRPLNLQVCNRGEQTTDTPMRQQVEPGREPQRYLCSPVSLVSLVCFYVRWLRSLTIAVMRYRDESCLSRVWMGEPRLRRHQMPSNSTEEFAFYVGFTSTRNRCGVDELVPLLLLRRDAPLRSNAT